MDLATGYLIVLPRDEAKQFFGHRQDEPRLAFIQELLGNDAIQRMNCEGHWQKLHDQLAAIKLENSVLAQAILGGRPLHQGDDFNVMLVRPDVVGFIASQLAELQMDDFADLAESLGAVQSVYQDAAKQGGAMVFVAKV